MCRLPLAAHAATPPRHTHRYLTTAKPSGSLPFNVLNNSASPQSASGWVTTQQLSFPKKDPDRTPGAGVRTEQL